MRILAWLWPAVISMTACGTLSGLDAFSGDKGSSAGILASSDASITEGEGGADGSAGDDAAGGAIGSDSAASTDGAQAEDVGPIGCDAGLVLCDGGCVDLTTTSNCGSCGNACPAVANAQGTCTSGTCGFSCNPGYALCSGACADLGSTTNCGACGLVCGGATPTCSAQADAGSHACACARASDCPVGYACNGAPGICTTACSSQHPCNGGCCSGGSCVAGTSPSACGANGGTCSNCSGFQSTGNVCLTTTTGGACGCNSNADCSAGSTCNTLQHTCGPA